MDGTASALIVRVDEADAVVGSWRAKLDPSAADGVGAHITMLYPFVHPDRIDTRVHAQIADVCARAAPVEFTFDEVCWFGDDLVWLRPTPSDALGELSDELQARFPDHPRYSGAHDTVEMHLTVAAAGTLEQKQAAADEVGAQLPVHCRADSVDLLVRNPEGRWEPVRKFPLGQSPASRLPGRR